MTTEADHVAAAPQAAPEDSAEATLKKMQEAHRKSAAPSYEERIKSLDKLERALLARKNAIAEAISRDFGNRSKHESMVSEVFLVVGAIKHAKAHLRDWMEPEEREVGWVFLPAGVELRPQPVGVVGIISPWNYPVQLALSPLVGVLAAGNRAIIKPSELVPETAALLRDLVAETFPADQVAVITGGPEVGEAFSHLPFDHLVFTGSTRVGKMVMRAASDNLVPVTLELGGKSPTIVGPDFSVRTAAERIMAGKLFNAGQTCIAPDYVMVPAGTRDAFVEACRTAAAKMYPTLEKNPDYTAIVNDKHYARLQSYVQDATTRGARVVELNPAGEPLEGSPSRKMAPTLVLDPTEEMLVLKEEIFGPILPVLTYQKIDEAIAYVNDHPRPLALYYFSHDKGTTERVLTETISGGVTLNETMLHVTQDDLPFGGVGPSGMGHYHAREGFDSFTKKKPVFRQARINTTGMLRPPYGKTVDRLLKFLLS
ncbi:MAG TPA: coniferyl aldehyde dehydrogenase [Polyangiaceae bacterium]|jgi:coniferyl-aldehyde dehydrogenase